MLGHEYIIPGLCQASYDWSTWYLFGIPPCQNVAQGLFNVRIRHWAVAQTRPAAPKMLRPHQHSAKLSPDETGDSLRGRSSEAQGVSILATWHECWVSLTLMSSELDRLSTKARHTHLINVPGNTAGRSVSYPYGTLNSKFLKINIDIYWIIILIISK